MKNVGDTAYAMSHAVAETCTVHTAAGLAVGRGTDEYQVTGFQLAAATENGGALDGPAVRRAGLAAKPRVHYKQSKAQLWVKVFG